MRPFHRMPQPFLYRFGPAGERLTIGGLCEWRRAPEDRRQWKLFHPIQPGGDHENMFVAPDSGRTHYEAGEQALYVQFFGEVQFQALLRAGEKVSGGLYERGRMRYGDNLVSAGDGSGSLVHGSRFINAARVAGTAIADLDLTEAESDQLVLIRTSIFLGAIAEVG